MDETIQEHFGNIHVTTNRPVETAAYYALMEATEKQVDWTYDVWDELVADLTDKDNHIRSIASQLLANLAAYSDPEQRILRDFEKLLNVTRDSRGVTARHSLQAIWKVGLAGDAQRKILLEGLTRRFGEAGTHKTGTLTRYDIAQGLRNLYDTTHDTEIQELALRLIETEPELKYRKKYATVWK